MGMRQHLRGDAAQHQFFKPATAMRAHHHQVGIQGFCRIQNSLVNRMTLHHRAIDGDRMRFKNLPGAADGFLRFLGGGAEVFGLAVGKVSTHAGKGIRVNDINQGDRAFESFGNGDSLADGQLGGGRAIDGNQDVLEHEAFLLQRDKNILGHTRCPVNALLAARRTLRPRS